MRQTNWTNKGARKIMAAQILAICIFIGMFLMIILDKFQRHHITLVSGALVLVLVFGVCMHSADAIWKTLNLSCIFTPGFWYGPSGEGSFGINWSTIFFIAGMMIMVEGLGKAVFSGGCVCRWQNWCTIGSCPCCSAL